jgi:hypothetical protein
MVEDNDLIIKNSLQEQSYDMSPYRSDDDEDEDDIPNHKFIPSWARFVTVQVSAVYPLNNIMAPSLHVIFGVLILSWCMCLCGSFFIQTGIRKIN